MLNAVQLLAECAQLLINIVIDWPATSQFGHRCGQMLCTLTLAGRAGAKGPTSAWFMMIPNRKKFRLSD